MKRKLGSKAVDKISGFEGTVTGRCKYLTGCVQYLLSPIVNAKGEMQDAHWFDESALINSRSTRSKGGPQRDAPKC